MLGSCKLNVLAIIVRLIDDLHRNIRIRVIITCDILVGVGLIQRTMIVECMTDIDGNHISLTIGTIGI